MRNRPSEQSKDGRYPRQNARSTEYRYVTKRLSDDPNNNDSRTTRRISTKTDSYFEYVPSVQSNQTQYLTSQGSNYKKPSLPYYVVPVLYVPQKVLSSEEIRPASAPLQNKRTVSFVVKNSEQSKKSTTESVDVDQIPCIPCETMRRLGLKKKNFDSEEVLMSNIDLDQPYAGYINACYTPSSTSAMEDVDCQNISANYPQRKPNNQTCSKYSDKVYECKRPSEDYNLQGYRHFAEHQRRSVCSQNIADLNEVVKADVRLRWNSEFCCYEKIENPSNTSKRSSECGEDANQKGPLRNRKDCGNIDYDWNAKGLDKNRSPETSCQRKQVTELHAKLTGTEGEFACHKEYTDYDKIPKRLDQSKNPETPCQRKQTTEVYAKATHTQEEFNCDEQYYNSRYETCKILGDEFVSPEDYPVYISYDDPDDSYSDSEGQRRCCASQVSTLSCEKQSELVGHVASLLGTTLTGTSCGTRQKKKRNPPDVLSIEPFPDPLDDASILKATRKQHQHKRKRRPKESQTTFDDVVIYSTYVATDETIRDSKSTQTLDAATMNVTTGTQTDRVLRTFASSPPQHVERARDDVGVSAKSRNREISPSPMRAKRNTSPTKQSIGDVKRGPVIRTVEVTPKSSMNQSIQNYPPKKCCKRKKVRASWSPT